MSTMFTILVQRVSMLTFSDKYKTQSAAEANGNVSSLQDSSFGDHESRGNASNSCRDISFSTKIVVQLYGRPSIQSPQPATRRAKKAHGGRQRSLSNTIYGCLVSTTNTSSLFCFTEMRKDKAGTSYFLSHCQEISPKH